LLLTNGFKTTKVPLSTFAVPRGYTVVTDMSKLDDRPKTKDNGPMKAIETVKKGNYH
jgi:hypothetical protein